MLVLRIVVALLGSIKLWERLVDVVEDMLCIEHVKEGTIHLHKMYIRRAILILLDPHIYKLAC